VGKDGGEELMGGGVCTGKREGGWAVILVKGGSAHKASGQEKNGVTSRKQGGGGY